MGRCAAVAVICACLLLAHACTAAAAAYRVPARNAPWQWQLSDEGTISKIKGVTVYDIDLDTAASQIKALRKAVRGVQVICYISVGTYENYRAPDDKRRGIKSSDWKGLLGKSYSPPFQDERWLDIRSDRVKTIMAKRFDYAKKIGCDGIEPDNTGAHEEDTGFPLKKSHAISYSKWIAKAVHQRRMSVGLKNSQSILPELHKYYDWFLNEQCSEDNSCGDYLIVGNKKAVLGVEYCDASAQDNGSTLDPACYCPQLLKWGFNWLIKNVDLDAKRMSCGAYCKKHTCTGRARGSKCRAKKQSTCSADLK